MYSVNAVQADKVLNDFFHRLKKQGTKLQAREASPMLSDYIPKLDLTAELDANDTNMFQELI